ncbi:M3 family metallopeptidase [Hoylesella nanceiensis]|uniref:M3 family metallopeptidase n=1 Tax=Hoylesella nanceiensis TaxID=425941 RepID=UPI001CB09116|nr:M3 family metallopeptidase [Hoylesella nanceiensis]MBF1420039.1 M3 family metallopeptidase [Hoylesella nanceiensis]MBF1436983.1 M3 family metallopeptidase [Hoylesella nanceiensis]
MATQDNKNSIANNPFFNDYSTPHNTVPFHLIKLEHYEEAFMEGMKREKEELDKIINNEEEPTFDNTIIYKDETKGEHYYDLLGRASTVFSCMLGAETNDDLDALAQKMSPLLTQHANDMQLNEKLFKRIKHVYEHHRELTPEEATLLQKVYDGFVRSGALLNEEGKEQFRRLSEEASLLSLQFSQNLLKENKAFELHITNEEDLDGLPESARQMAAHTAQEQNKEGWIFTLDFPSYSPFLTYSTKRELREKLYMAKNTEGIHDNSENNLAICTRLINIRRELAQLLGHDTYADYVLEHRMASSVKNVYKLFNDLISAYKPQAIKELKEVEQLAKEMEGDAFEMQPWDFGYYSHKLQLQKYNIDSEMLRPYFELSKVIEGVFGLANRLYGISFKENNEIPVYHQDVKAYDVFDADGSYLAVFYADFHPRKGKQGGAWMTEFQGQWINRKGENIRPHVSVVMNFTKPTPQKPALLTLGEVETFLHEFGHSLHGMFANTRFGSLSGTNVWWDFVELPSQFMENYATEKEFLRTFAYHFESGEPIPDELIDRIIKSKNYLSAYGCLRQVSLGLLDMAYYTQKDEFKEDIITFEKDAWKDAIITKQLPNTCMTTQFSHIISGGYAAGYYSYKWAEVLDADAFSLFKKNGIFDKNTALSFRENILSKGGTEHPMTLYKRFRGQEPTIDALLERNGIKKN